MDSNDPRNNCGTHFVSSSLFVSNVAKLSLPKKLFTAGLHRLRMTVPLAWLVNPEEIVRGN